MKQVARGQAKMAFVVSGICLVAALTLYVMAFQMLAELPNAFVLQTANLLILAGLTALLSGFHAHTAVLAADERAEADGAPKQDDMFGEGIDAGQRRQRALSQFEKGVIPVILLGFSALEVVLAVFVLRGVKPVEMLALRDANLGAVLPVAATCVALALLVFFVGKYCVGAAYGNEQVFLRPVAAVALGMAGVAVGTAVVAALVYSGYPVWAVYWARLTCWLALVLAVERILVWVVELYRPKRSNETSRPVYESRLLGLFSQPHGPMATLAEIVEYQFGFKLSTTALLIFGQRRLLPFLAVQVMALMLLTSLVHVQTFEKGLAERWGSDEIAELEPGLHVCLPWPMTRVTRVPVARASIVEIGNEGGRALPAIEAVEGVTLWGDSRQRLALCRSRDANSANLATVSLAVSLSTQTPLACSEPERVQRALAERALTHFLLEHEIVDLLSADLRSSQAALVAAMNQEGEAMGTGVAVDWVAIRRLQPPAAVASAFDGVLRAGQKAREAIAEARQVTSEYEATAESEANQMVAEATAETIRTRKLAEVEVANFRRQLAVYRAHPELYTTREHMALLETWLADVNKVVLAKRSMREVISLDLKQQTDLLGPLED